jgi:hypothetical protein
MKHADVGNCIMRGFIICNLLNITRMIKSRNVRRAGHVARKIET